MTTKLSEGFERQFAKLSKKQKEQVIDAIELFLNDPMEPSLRRHALREEWAGWHSISASNDLRLHFKMLGDNMVHFVAVGTHSQLYK